jgi:hypothetical protein
VLLGTTGRREQAQTRRETAFKLGVDHKHGDGTPSKPASRAGSDERDAERSHQAKERTRNGRRELSPAEQRNQCESARWLSSGLPSSVIAHAPQRLVNGLAEGAIAQASTRSMRSLAVVCEELMARRR